MVRFRYGVVAVFDVDGVFSDGGFYSTKEGKFLKKFGPDDWDCIKELQKYMKVYCITADRKGFEIVRKRFEDEMGFDLYEVPHKPCERWLWIERQCKDKEIIYVADGVYDWYALSKSNFSITTSDALRHVRTSAKWVINRVGGHRFVAEACLVILEKYCDVDTNKIGLNV